MKIVEGVNVNINSIIKDDNTIKLNLNFYHSQAVKVRFKYKNKDIGIDRTVEVDMFIHAQEPYLTFNYGNRDIRGLVQFFDHDFDSSVIQRYEWDFGDNSPVVNTSTPTTLHRYSSPGNYEVSVKMYNSSSVMLYEKKSTAYVEDRIYFYTGGSDDLSIYNIYYNPTNYIGFKYVYIFEGDGTCYANDLEYLPTGNGVKPWMVFYNCSVGNLFP
ncbi:hypothetical protein C0V70_07705 [Bacteriovorax stolpii]|uniref:Uncharacterized protein n=1 Tax=Bacteriovorax stolpii TaxID=960 RepID=A0A2K9NTB9_BACTC|nr:PKD domain-containing protein [Bacteriovorax stolpii]AUN97994.1 hypothetical protein C0V70_07705 [Bacteriovorax stolpii]TDP50318.1 PKD domain-containing protein [Bacteriovorax stolpii]